MAHGAETHGETSHATSSPGGKSKSQEGLEAATDLMLKTGGNALMDIAQSLPSAAGIEEAKPSSGGHGGH